MPTDGTEKHIFRCPPEIWEPAAAVAAKRNESLSDVLRRALVEYARTGGEWPPRS